MSKQSDIKPVGSPASELEEARPLYFLPQDDLKGEVLIPGFQAAETADCMVGFFSSAVLAELAPGLASYIQKASSGFRMIISPFLSEADRQALRDGVKNPEDIAFESLSKDLITTNDLQRHTLRCLSYLIARERIEIKIALMRNALFHPKVWIFSIPGGRVAVHGSSNMTQAGLVKNKEQISVSKSWVDPTQKYIVGKLSEEFERLWKGEDQDCRIVPLPEAINGLPDVLYQRDC